MAAQILAKSKKDKSKESITLELHTAELLSQLNELKKKVGSKAGSYAVPWTLIENAAALHDLGKAQPSFQVNSVGNWDYAFKAPFPTVPHSIFSLFCINPAALEELSDEDRRIILSAIAFHHWRDTFSEIISGTNNDFIDAAKRLEKDEEFRNGMIHNLKQAFEVYEGLKIYSGNIGYNHELASLVAEGGDLFSHITPPYLGYFLPQRTEVNEDFKKKYIFTSGFLMRADHFASFKHEESSDDKIEQVLPLYNAVEMGVKNYIKSKFPSADVDGLWQMQVLKEKKDSNLIVVAPTGSGKTELAALWGAGSKLFFTLPLRSAVNANFERMKKYFGQSNVGLLHSDADVYMYEKAGQQVGENMRVLDMARQLALPVQVSTGDQIFPAALKYPGYEKIHATLAYSRLVIDEVQAYDPRSAAIIVKMIEDVVKLGGKFMLMTATLPDFINNEIRDRVGEDNFKSIDKYEGLEGFCKHEVMLHNSEIEDAVEEIIKTALEGKRVLVIANTVKKAQALYDKLKDLPGAKTRLLHSRFTLKDRADIEADMIETEFKNPKFETEHAAKILVATQVVEASLDIDADVLFTEIAPMDALVQRMGRVMRRYRQADDVKEKGPINIYCSYMAKGKGFELESGGGRVYDNDLLVLTIAELKGQGQEQDVTEYLKSVYPDKSKEGKKKQKNSPGEILQSILGFENQTILKPFSELDKKNMVQRVFERLPDESRYKKRFYDILSVLDAGYVSDRKADAAKLFREIYTMPVIAYDKMDDFTNAVAEFCKSDDFLWTRFKSEVLSRFTINISRFSFDRSASTNTSALNYEPGIDKDKMKKIIRWTEDIRFIKDGEYKPGIGFILNPNKDWRWDM